MKKDFRMFTEEVPVAFSEGEWQMATRVRRVRVMCIAEGYAMVRFPQALPFCTSLKTLSEKKL